MKYLKCLFAVLILVLLVSGPALAHKVNLFAYAEQGTVFTESYFPDAGPWKKERCWFMTAKTRSFWKGRPTHRGCSVLTSPRSMR